jgi:hypothetical protein
MKGYLGFIVVFILGLGAFDFAARAADTTPVAYSASITLELKRLNKCYALWVKQRIAMTDPLWIKVSTGAMSGTDACMSILDLGMLNSSGTLAQNADGSYNTIGAAVQASFLQSHMSIFSVSDVSTTVARDFIQTGEVNDYNSPAYHFSYSLFAPNEKFSNIVTRTYDLHAIRDTTKTSRTMGAFTSNLTFLQDGGPHASLVNGVYASATYPWNPTLIETGTLVGLKPESVVNAVQYPPSMTGLTTAQIDAYRGLNVGQNHGGGILGSQAYLLGNNDKLTTQTVGVDGGINSYRLWSKAVLGDLLCRSLPALRSSDVLAGGFVQITSTLPYRQGISCMQCHASMDPMAGTIRNLRLGYSLYIPGSGYGGVKYYAHFDPTMASAPYPELGPDANFFKRPADGNVEYRSYDGTLINETVSGVADLGAKLAATNDLYACAAKNYYRFLTGITVDLSDAMDPINPPSLSAADLAARNKVIALGQQLKTDQSLRSLVKNIVSSAAFVSPELAP